MRKRVTEAAVLGVLAGVAGCTSLLGIGGDFKVEGSGGATSSSTGAGNGGAMTGGGGSTPTGGGGNGGALPSGPITGHQSYIQLGPKSQTPITTTPTEFVTDAADNVLEVIVQHENGDWQTFTLPGGKDDGTFKFDGVPPGPYLLHLHNISRFNEIWAWMNNRVDVDLDVYTPERPLIEPLVNDPEANFNITGMTPWSDVDSDYLTFYSATTGGSGGLSSPNEMDLGFGPGSTSIMGSLDWNTFIDGYPNPLLTSADPLWFVKYTNVGGAYPHGTIIDAANPIMVAMQDVDGFPVDVQVNFAPVPQDQTLKVNIDLAAFNALVSSFRSDATDPASNVIYRTTPVTASAVGDDASGVDLMDYYGTPGDSLLQTTFHFGNPFPTDAANGWDSQVLVLTGANIPFQRPDCPTTKIGIGVINLFLRPDDPLLDPTKQLKPPVGVATNAEVDGHSLDATNLVTLDSRTPTLTWGPPSKGTVNFWAIKIREVQAVMDDPPPPQQPTCVSIKLGPGTLIYIGGDATSVTIPPGLLNPNSYYEFGIIGVDSPNSDYEKAPTRASPPYYEVNRISETFGTPAN